MQIYILITEKCNLSCKMCIRGAKNNRELKLIELQNLPWIDEFKQHDIVITGGEPTLGKEFYQIVSFFKDYSNSLSICTNGTDSSIVDFVDNNENIGVQISIDGTEMFHDAIRGSHTYKRIFETIKQLELSEIPYTVSSVVNKYNMSCMKELSDILGSLKSLKYWNVSYEMPFGHGSFADLISAEDWNHFVDEMLEYVCFRMKIKKMFPFDLFDKNREKLDIIFNNAKCYNCGSGRNKIYVYPDLNVYPCTCLTDFCLGNLKDSSLYSIMKGEEAQKFADYTVLPESECSKCEYLKYCNGGCIGMSYNLYKRLGLGDIRCPKLNG